MNETISNFTDIFADEICESQPLSLTLSTDSHFKSGETNNKENVTKRPAKHTGQNGNFRSVEEIDPKFRSVFSYPFFNLVQSSIIEDALYSDKSMVVCAPTGSGKTVVFEMAIVQLLMEMDDQNSNEDFKIIYMAPVKAVCTERLTEWYPKFTKLGLLCIEVTGDTDVDFSQLKPYKIIITTPEKWDILTRRWTDYRGLVGMIKLFLIDEVHILNDEARGPVLEAVVSRMKTIESSSQSAYRIEKLQKQYQGIGEPMGSSPKIRFVAVSATVSNPEDVAAWLTSREKTAVFHKFGDDSRPVRLKRIVEGYPCAEGNNIFKFDIMLNYKLWPIIQKYYDGKPTLIFCNTRKSVLQTAERLSLELTISFNPEQKAKLTALATTIKNKKLQTLVLSGVGCHHAGLLFEERVSIEQAFRRRDLPILITTTTLAMGVNLPAHLVIVKNTQQYVNGAYQEYSITTVLQMVGRAGRPQFDTEATAVIMTRMQDKQRYESLVGGSEPLQSYLHKRLTENLNSEAALHTVTDVAQCVQWLQSTFLYVRAAKDPKRYLGLPNAAAPHLISKKIEELCVKAMNGLASSGLITMDEASCIESTEAGRLMSVYYLDFETMKMIMKIEGTETLEQLLWLVCSCHELSDMHLRMDERRFLNTLNRNNAAHTVRFPMKGRITTRQMKLSCIIQAILGSLPIPDPSLHQEAMRIMRIAARVCRCLVAYVISRDLATYQSQFHSGVLNSILLAKCLSAQLWENSPFVSRQLKGIGPTFSNLLATAGKSNFMLLEETHPRDLERIMNKGPPAGNVIRKQISLLPKYQMTVTPVDEKTVTVQLLLLNQSHLSENMDCLTAGEGHKSYVLVGDSENYVLLLTSFKDKDLITVFDGLLTYTVTRKHRFDHKILAHCISTSYVGIDAQCEFTFKGLDPMEPRVTNQHTIPIEDTPRIKIMKKQTNITDTFKERKRRINEDDVTQSKEKNKRDSVLIERFKKLKQSFGTSTRELQNDLQNTAQMSNLFLHDLTNKEKPTSEIVCLSDGAFDEEFQTIVAKCGQEPTTAMSKGFNDVSSLDIDESCDFMDDSHIDIILNEIENEIGKKTDETNQLPGVVLDSNFVDPRSISMLPIIKSNEKFEASSKDSGINSSFFHGNEKDMSGSVANIQHGDYSKITANKNRIRPTKSTNKTNNYSFIELLERNVELSDDEVICEKERPTGFSEAIKDHIQQFLQKAKTSATNYNANILDKDLLECPDVSMNVKEKTEDEDNSIHISTDCFIVKDNDVFEEYINNNTYANIAKEKHNSENKPMEKVTEILDRYENETREISTVQKLFRNLSTENEHQEHTTVFNDTATENDEYNALLASSLMPQTNKTVNKEQLNTYHNMPEIKPKEDRSMLSLVPLGFENTNENQSSPRIEKQIMNDNKNSRATPPLNTGLDKMLHVARNSDASEIKTHNALVPFQVEPKLVELNDRKRKNLNNNQMEVMERNETNSLIPVGFKHLENSSLIPFTRKRMNHHHEMSLLPIGSNNTIVPFDKNLSRLIANKKSIEVTASDSLATKPAAYLSQIYPKEPGKLDEMAVSKIYEIHPRHFSMHNKENNPWGKTLRESDNGLTLQYMTKYSYSTTEIDVWTKSVDSSRLQVLKKLTVDLDITEIVSQKTTGTGQDYSKSDNFSDRKLNNKSTKYSNNHTANSQPTNFNDSLQSGHKEICKEDEMVFKYMENAIKDTKSLNKPEQKKDQRKESTKNNNQRKAFVAYAKNEIDDITSKSVESIPVSQSIEQDKKANDTVDMASKDVPNSAVENILQKYANTLREKADSTQAFKREKPSKETISQKTKPKRPFKITDIHRVNATLPKSFTDISLTPFTQITQDQNNTEDVQMQHQDTNPTTIHVARTNLPVGEEIEEDVTEVNPSPEVDCNDLESIDNYKIDHSMLDPKALLQFLSPQEEEIIPPPMQFSDTCNQLYSPTRSDSDTNDEMFKYASYLEEVNTFDDINVMSDTTSYEREDKSIFEESDRMETAPCKETETWTLATEEHESFTNVTNSPFQLFTIMRAAAATPRPRIMANTSSNNRFMMDRKSKLENFKFNMKPKFKARRNLH